MTPKNSNNTGCVNSVPSSCIPWTGPSIPCLNIKTGDSLTVTVGLIADEVVEITKGLDLEAMDISCLIDKTPPANKSLKSLLELLFANQCSLKDLIQTSGGSSPATSFSVNMKCLKKFDDFDNEIVLTEQQAIQTMVTEICFHGDRLTLLEQATSFLQQQINEIDVNPTAAETQIVTCITPTARPISQVISLVAQDACSYKEKVGPVLDIQQAMARQDSTLNSLLGTIEGWIMSPTNLSQSVNNIQMAVSNLLARVKLIEDNCCRVTCADVKVGFDVVPNTDNDAVFIKFTAKAGTAIPAGFEDAGSVMTITDKGGVSVEYPIEVSNNGNEGEFLITGLDLTDFLDINITVKMTADAISCEKCVNKRWKPSSTCSYCEIVVTGTDPDSQLIITYEE